MTGNFIQRVAVEEKDLECSLENDELNIFVANKFREYKKAMETCDKISREGTNLTEIRDKEQYRMWHQQGNANKVFGMILM